ncbi:MAG: universal stress protein [Planctomycetaceae bacterium]
MLPRFHHILIPVDAVPKDNAAIDIAFELAVENKARVSLLHVIQTISTGEDSPDHETQQFYDRVQQRLEVDMERLSQRFADAKLAVDARIRVGDRLEEIVGFAEPHGVDLIVMSSHRIDPNRLAETWGTLSYKVSVLCECPILLVK